MTSPGAQIDQVVVMLVRDRLVAAPPGAEIMPGDDAGILEQLDRAVDGGDRNAGIDGGGAAVELLDVGMIGRRLEHAGDDPALLGHAHALGDAGVFEWSWLMPSHARSPRRRLPRLTELQRA